MSKQVKVSAFQLAMLIVAFMASVRVLPIMAEFGSTCLFYYLLAGVLFLVPTALVSAELATSFPQRGGVYIWVREALGSKLGFLAIWMQFVANLIVLPTFLSFVGATLAYVFMPQLANNKLFLIAFILLTVWGATFMSYFGMKFSGWINTIGAALAVFIPVIIIVILGIVWIALSYGSEIDLSASSFFPDFGQISLRSLVFLAGILFSLGGMETSGAHVLDVRDMHKNYPKGIFFALLIIFCLGFGALSIAIVVPHHELSLVAGLMQAFVDFFSRFHIQWMVPVMALCIVFGALAGINSNIIGPSKGLVGAAQCGEIPPFLTKRNKNGMPVNMFIFQGILVSILTMLMLVLPGMNNSYWLMAVIVTIIYLCMYILLFLSAIVLHYKKPLVCRPYKVPGGNIGMWIICIMGILSSMFSIFFAFMPPPDMPQSNFFTFETVLIIGVLVFICLGFIINFCKKAEWLEKSKEFELIAEEI